MTERRRRPGPFPVIGTAIATFLAVLVLLAVQLQGGHDPVLGTVQIASPSAGQHGPKVVTRASGGGAGGPAAQRRRDLEGRDDACQRSGRRGGG